MRAVPTIATAAGLALRTAVLSAALACASTGAYATGVASVIINTLFVQGFSASGDFLFAPSNTRSQSWDLQALTNNVVNQQSTGNVANWNNLDRTAQNSQARATFSSGVDSAGGLETPRFSLTATANHSGNNTLFTALGNMFTQGSLCFWNPNTAFDGTSASCTGSGSLALTLFYDLIVGAGSGDSAYAEIDLLGDGVPGGLFFDATGTGLGPSRLDQSFSWSTDLTAGNAASFLLAGTVVAEAVPEPGVLSLLAIGLIGLALTRRRHTRAS